MTPQYLSDPERHVYAWVADRPAQRLTPQFERVARTLVARGLLVESGAGFACKEET